MIKDLERLEGKVRAEFDRCIVATQRREFETVLVALRAEATINPELAAWFARTPNPQLGDAIGGYAGVPKQPENIALVDNLRDMRMDTEAWYYKAHRLTKVCGFPCPAGIRDVRNHLLEHPEGHTSGVSHPSFGWGLESGPKIKGLRIGDQAGRFEDAGMFANSDELRAALERFIDAQP